MNKVLGSAGFPVPKATAFNEREFKEKNLEFLMEDLHFPVVIKPTNGTALGQDVICNINNTIDLDRLLKKKFVDHKLLTIEEFHGGLKSYRVLVFFNKVIGVVQRFPAHVIADGIHTIAELIDITNIEREKLKDHLTLGPIQIDEEVHIRLKEMNLTLESIATAQECIVLLHTCNSSRGGTMTSLGKSICPENARLICQAAKALNLDFVGFDVACEDILIPIKKSRGIIIEANYNPDLTIHENPISGIPCNVSKKIVQRLILQHPIAYFARVYQHKKKSVSTKSMLIIFMFIAFKLLKIY
jgi:cyanophycin synthetase